MVKYSKDYKLINTFKTKGYVFDICKYDDNNILLGEGDNNIEIINIDLMQSLYHY